MKVMHWFCECATVNTFRQKFEKRVKNEIDINLKHFRNDIIFTGIGKLNPKIKKISLLYLQSGTFTELNSLSVMIIIVYFN